MTAIANNFLGGVKRNFGWAVAGLGIAYVASSLYKDINKYRLAGKVVLITGGSSGLGLVLARQLAEKGTILAICSRTSERNDRAEKELKGIGAEVLALTVDLSEPEKVAKMIKKIIAHYGHIDVVINNAGIIQAGPQEEMDLKDYHDAMNSNFWAPLHVMKAIIPHFKTQNSGRIVNVTSVGGKVSIPNMLPYSVSKHALVGLSEGMHAELKKDNIHVTTVVPFLMRTGSADHIIIKGSESESAGELMKEASQSILFAQDAEESAGKIIRAIEYGESEVALSVLSKAATVLQGIAPGWLGMIIGIATNYLKPVN
jgi:short-subunit dehydrogenase